MYKFNTFHEKKITYLCFIMKKTVVLTLAAALLALFSCTPDSPRTISDFNFDWRFSLGDSQEYSQPDFDDSAWRSLHLPHDWSVEGDFS